MELIQKAIDAGVKGSSELSDIHDQLDGLLTAEKKDTVVRDFFDSWADAINHDYMVYKTQDPQEWLEAAEEIQSWYQNDDAQLSQRALWKETLRCKA